MKEFENNTNERIVCVNITKTQTNGDRPNLYERARKYWRLNGNRAQKADLVFAICNKHIIGVFKPKIWYLTECTEEMGRWEFEGEELKDSPYLNMSIANLWGKRQNPVMYINM